jgi:hypothetical protein
MEKGEELLSKLKKQKEDTRLALATATGLEQLALQVNEQLIDAQIGILKNKGIATFDIFFDKNGEEITASSWFVGKFGKNTRVFHFHDGTKKYSEATTAAGLARIGVSVKQIVSPAWAKIKKKDDGVIPSPYDFPIKIYQSKYNYYTGE